MWPSREAYEEAMRKRDALRQINRGRSPEDLLDMVTRTEGKVDTGQVPRRARETVGRPRTTEEELREIIKAEGKVDTGQLPKDVRGPTKQPIYPVQTEDDGGGGGGDTGNGGGNGGGNGDTGAGTGTGTGDNVRRNPDGTWTDTETGKTYSTYEALQQARVLALEGKVDSGQGTFPMAESPQFNKFTGAWKDIDELLREMSTEYGGRERIFREQYLQNPAYRNAPRDMQRFIQGRFQPYQSEWLANQSLYPSDTGDMGRFDLFLKNRRPTTSMDWQKTYGGLMGKYGGVEGQGDYEGLSGPDQAGYDILRNQGVGILQGAVGANLNPLAARHARGAIQDRFDEYASLQEGGRSNQADFFRQQRPRWETILGLTP